MRTLLLGLGHKARNGKDTAAAAIIAARGEQYDVRRYAFADAVKIEVQQAAEECGGMLGLFTRLSTKGIPTLPSRGVAVLPEWVTYDPEPDMTDPYSPLGKQRLLLQWWGTDFRRNLCDPFYWVRAMKRRLEQDNPQVAIIPDVRFINEALWVHANQGRLIKVVRKGFTSINEHVSEHELNTFRFDYEIQVDDKPNFKEELSADAVEVFDQIVNSFSVAEQPECVEV